MKLKFITFVFLAFSLASCADDTSGTASDKERSNQSGSDTNGEPGSGSENAVSPAERSKALESGETWSLLTEDDVFTSKQDVVLYRTSQLIEELCVLSPGFKYIISNKSDAYITIRLDRIAQEDNCPLDQQSSAYIKAEDFNANEKAEYGEGPHDGLEPHTLTFDLKIFQNSDKADPPLCVIAKGNAVLVNPGDSSIQVPVSRKCGSEVYLGYYRYVPGIWWEDQPM